MSVWIAALVALICGVAAVVSSRITPQKEHSTTVRAVAMILAVLSFLSISYLVFAGLLFNVIN